MSSDIYAGIDTSSYTTSVAAVDASGQVVCDLRWRLPVPTGEIGLRQSAAVFAHLKHARGIMDEFVSSITGKDIAGICVSSRPRPQEDSYLPVFVAGVSLAAAMAAGRCHIQETSHQQGHLWCIPGFAAVARCIAVHASGGTTEIVVVDRAEGQSEYAVIARTVDLHAGQFIDRIGAKMGLSFPAGPELDMMALRDDAIEIPSAVKDGEISFSGPHAAALRLLEGGATQEAVAAAVLLCIARSLAKGIKQAVDRSGIYDVYIAGGVAASTTIRQWLNVRLPRMIPGVQINFCPVQLCTDNAVGVATIAQRLCSTG